MSMLMESVRSSLGNMSLQAPPDASVMSTSRSSKKLQRRGSALVGDQAAITVEKPAEVQQPEEEAMICFKILWEEEDGEVIAIPRIEFLPEQREVMAESPVSEYIQQRTHQILQTVVDNLSDSESESNYIEIDSDRLDSLSSDRGSAVKLFDETVKLPSEMQLSPEYQKTNVKPKRKIAPGKRIHQLRRAIQNAKINSNKSNILDNKEILPDESCCDKTSENCVELPAQENLPNFTQIICKTKNQHCEEKSSPRTKYQNFSVSPNVSSLSFLPAEKKPEPRPYKFRRRKIKIVKEESCGEKKENPSVKDSQVEVPFPCATFCPSIKQHSIEADPSALCMEEKDVEIPDDPIVFGNAANNTTSSVSEEAAKRDAPAFHTLDQKTEEAYFGSISSKPNRKRIAQLRSKY